MFDGVGAGCQGHALAGGREAVHCGDFMEGVRLINDGVHFFLRHVADIRLFLVRTAAAGGTGFDDVAACQ